VAVEIQMVVLLFLIAFHQLVVVLELLLMVILAVQVAVLGSIRICLLLPLRVQQQAEQETHLQHLQAKAIMVVMVGQTLLSQQAVVALAVLV
jgi:hypothetical protein